MRETNLLIMKLYADIQSLQSKITKTERRINEGMKNIDTYFENKLRKKHEAEHAREEVFEQMFDELKERGYDVTPLWSIEDYINDEVEKFLAQDFEPISASEWIARCDEACEIEQAIAYT